MALPTSPPPPHARTRLQNSALFIGRLADCEGFFFFLSSRHWSQGSYEILNISNFPRKEKRLNRVDVYHHVVRWLSLTAVNPKPSTELLWQWNSQLRSRASAHAQRSDATSLRRVSCASISAETISCASWPATSSPMSAQRSPGMRRPGDTTQVTLIGPNLFLPSRRGRYV